MLSRKLLLVLTTIYLVIVTVYIYEQKTILPFHVEKEISQEDPGRNERSTPREFILPATSAVARAQENKHKLKLQGVDIGKCLAIIRSKGFSLMSDEIIRNVELKRAIMIVQKEIDMTQTGNLDFEFATKLGCTQP